MFRLSSVCVDNQRGFSRASHCHAHFKKGYYVEQRRALNGDRVPHPFKCGPRENADAWKLVVDEFFGASIAFLRASE